MIDFSSTASHREGFYVSWFPLAFCFLNYHKEIKKLLKNIPKKTVADAN